MWSHLESKMTSILCNAFVAMFEENPKVKEKFYSGLSAAASDARKVKNGENVSKVICQFCLTPISPSRIRQTVE